MNDAHKNTTAVRVCSNGDLRTIGKSAKNRRNIEHSDGLKRFCEWVSGKLGPNESADGIAEDLADMYWKDQLKGTAIAERFRQEVGHPITRPNAR